MEISRFDNKPETKQHFEELHTNGSTCDTFRTRMYGKMVFVKRLKEEFRSDIRYRESLRKEFEVGFSLEHPNLARYISLNDNEVYIEYIDGETLTEKLKNDTEYFNKKKNSDKFIKQLLSAVQYMHSHQVLHLDIKPDNILLTRINNDVKLIDLGFCYTDTFSDSTGYTKQYCSPEQIEGLPTDERSDIYAIGRIIEQLPNRHIYKKVITRCTALNKEERFQSIEDIKLPQTKRITAITALCIVILALCTLYIQYNTTDYATPATEPNHSIKQTESPADIAIPVKSEQINNVHSTTVEEKNTQPAHEAPATTNNTQETTYLQLSPEAIRNIEAAYASGEELLRTRAEEIELYKPKVNEYFKKVLTFSMTRQTSHATPRITSIATNTKSYGEPA